MSRMLIVVISMSPGCVFHVPQLETTSKGGTREPVTVRVTRYA